MPLFATLNYVLIVSKYQIKHSRKFTNTKHIQGITLPFLP